MVGACPAQPEESAGTRESTSCPPPHPRNKMSNTVLSPAKSRIIWTEKQKVHKAKVSVTSRSRNRIDGFPSPMVGHVLYPPPNTVHSSQHLICPSLA